MNIFRILRKNLWMYKISKIKNLWCILKYACSNAKFFLKSKRMFWCTISNIHIFMAIYKMIRKIWKCPNIFTKFCRLIPNIHRDTAISKWNEEKWPGLLHWPGLLTPLDTGRMNCLNRLRCSHSFLSKPNICSPKNEIPLFSKKTPLIKWKLKKSFFYL